MYRGYLSANATTASFKNSIVILPHWSPLDGISVDCWLSCVIIERQQNVVNFSNSLSIPEPPPPPTNHQEGQVAGSASRGTPRRFRVVIKRTLQGGRCGVTRIECGVFTAYRMASLTTMLLRLLLRSRKHKIRSHLCSQEEINCFLLALRDTELDIVLPLWRIY